MEVLGVVLFLIGDIWMLVLAFKTSIWWGLGSFFIPFVGLFFILLHLGDTWKPLLLQIVGAVLFFVNRTPALHH